jgi:hypothetical protein
MHPSKIDNILNLSAEDRYGYFIRKVADFEEVWLIKDQDGYAIFGDQENKTTIGVFPEKEFAELFLTDTWSNCVLESKDLNVFMEWLDKLENDKIQLAGFPNKDLKAIVVEPKEMKSHLLFELQQYE